MMKNRLGNKIKNLIIIQSFVVLLSFSCQQNYTPKPNAHFRIDLPEKAYRMYDTIFPFTFEYPVYGKLEYLIPPTPDSCWLNIIFPKYRGTIHLTYGKVNNNLEWLKEDIWKIVYSKISQRADFVDDSYLFYEPDVYSVIYDIKGDAASPMQFLVTDSVKNFLRGSLYFSVKPNYDSLAPVINFFREDVIHLIETVRWK